MARYGRVIDPDLVDKPKSKPKRKGKPEPKPPWIRSITEQMVDRANRRPSASYASRADLLHGPSRSVSASDRFEDLTGRGFKR